MIDYNRFGQNYELIIQLKDNSIVIKPPFKIQFDVTKSIDRKLNKAQIKIFNISEHYRQQLSKKKEEDKQYLRAILKVGYQSIGIIFQGNIQSTKTARESSDITITLTCVDGGYDIANSFTSKTVKSKSEAIKAISSDMKNTQLGLVTTQKETLRPKVLVGNSHKLIERNLQFDEDYFIDDEKIYILKKNEVISDYSAVVNSETGLLTTPTITYETEGEDDNKNEIEKISFDSLMNPTIRVAGLVNLKSLYETKLNGVYKVESIQYNGEYDSNNWKQTVIARTGTFKKVEKKEKKKKAK